MIQFSFSFRNKLHLLSTFKQQQFRINIRAASTSTPTLFMIPGSDGVKSIFDPLISKLNCKAHVFPKEHRNFGKNVKLPTLLDIVNDHIQELKQVQPDGPYNLAGFSLGSTFTLEMAIQLQKIYKDKIEKLIFLEGFYGCGIYRQVGMKKAFEILFGLLEANMGMSPSEQEEILSKSHPTDNEKNRQLLLEMFERKSAAIRVSNERLSEIRRSFESMVALAAIVDNHAITGTYKGNVHFIKARTEAFSSYGVSPENMFQRFCVKRINCKSVEGNHFTFLHEENVQETAKIVNTILKSA